MTPQETFITRLRRHRERNRISLDEIVSATRIKREQLEAFESGDLTVWPRGIYARAWIRGYAGVIGLDPSDTVDEFCRLFPQGDRRAEAIDHAVRIGPVRTISHGIRRLSHKQPFIMGGRRHTSL
jgi:cytoskeletal protein RodZ